MKLGKNKAIKLINVMRFDDIIDDRVSKPKILKTGEIEIECLDLNSIRCIDEIEDFNFEELVDYLSNLEIPYDTLERFFNGEIIFCDTDYKETGDDWDWLGIDKHGEIYCWTETGGVEYYLKDYGKKWLDYTPIYLKEHRETLKDELFTFLKEKLEEQSNDENKHN